MRARGDARTLVGALVVGCAFDVAVHNGLVTVSGTALAAMTAVCLAVSGRLRSWGSRGLVALAPLLSMALVFRSSTWVVVVAGCAIATVVALGVSFAEDESFRSTFPALAGRIARAGGHFMLGIGMLRPEPDQRWGSAVRERAGSILRAVAIAGPVVAVIGALLASADPVFGSWFNVTPVVRNLSLVGLGAVGLLGLARAASAKEPVPELSPAPRLGTVEVVSVLGSLCVLYAAFVAAQLVALAGGADHVLETSGLTYAQYARSGFFQLLAAASITVVVLLSLRACADRSRPAVLVVSEATVALTLAVVVVAIRRLDLYESVFGLTMLRLASTVTAVWIGGVFVLIGVAVAHRGRADRRGLQSGTVAGCGAAARLRHDEGDLSARAPRGSTGRWLAPTVVLSAVAFVAVWAAANPAAVVAEHNLRRDTAGSTFDVAQAMSLGSDAVPTLVAGLDDLDPTDRGHLRSTLCSRRSEAADGAAYNHAEARADQALEDVC